MWKVLRVGEWCISVKLKRVMNVNKNDGNVITERGVIEDTLKMTGEINGRWYTEKRQELDMSKKMKQVMDVFEINENVTGKR